MLPWSLSEIIALSRLTKLSNAMRIALVQEHDALQGALQSVGALELGLYDEAQTILDDADRMQVQVVTYWHDTYPQRLRTLDQPPMVLFVKGDLPASSSRCIAVVGTRSCTLAYGKPVTELLVREWTHAGCAIVSGLAHGIDMLSHEACIRAGGITVAVIASGIGRITPIVAQRMASRIVDSGGAIVSEHPVQTAALPPYFPARNRIIAALSDAIVVVESKDKGGALITADFALKQSIPVWSVPGPITSSRSNGTNQLIASGRARTLCSASALLMEMYGRHDAVQKPLKTPLPPRLEKLGGDPFVPEQAATLLHCSIAEALVTLFDLELEGAVHALPGGRYVVA